MLTKLSSKTCSVLLLVICLVFSLLLAYSIATTYGVTTEYVAITKIIDAPADHPIEMTNIPLAITIGVVALSLFATLSLLASELFYCILEFLRQRIRTKD